MHAITWIGMWLTQGYVFGHQEGAIEWMDTSGTASAVLFLRVWNGRLPCFRASGRFRIWDTWTAPEQLRRRRRLDHRQPQIPHCVQLTPFPMLQLPRAMNALNPLNDFNAFNVFNAFNGFPEVLLLKIPPKQSDDPRRVIHSGRIPSPAPIAVLFAFSFLSVVANRSRKSHQTAPKPASCRLRRQLNQ